MIYEVLPEINLRAEDVIDTLRENGGVFDTVEVDAPDGSGKVSGMDVTQCFQEKAKVNPFSLRKPYRKAAEFIDTWESGFVSRFDADKNVTYLEYGLPRGGTLEPYRLGDFRGYNAKAKTPQLGPNDLVFELNDPVGRPTTGGAVSLVINYAKPIFRMLRDEFYTDSFRLKGLSGTEILMDLDGDGGSISLFQFTPTVATTCAKNPGVPSIKKYVGELYQSTKPDRCYEVTEAPLELKLTTIVKAPEVSVNQQNFKCGLVHRVQSEFTFDTPAFSGEFFAESNIAFTWYSINADKTIRFYVVLKNVLFSTYDFINSTYVNNGLGVYKLRAYAGDVEADGRVVKLSDFSSVDMSNSGKCAVRYWDVFDLDTYLSVNTGASWFGFERSVYQNYINDKPMVIIDTPIRAEELTADKRIICVSISTY